jgi:hypothetical protein
MGKIRAPFRCLGRRRYERSVTVDDEEQEQEQRKRGQGPNVLTPQECETMGQIRFLGGRRYKRSIDDDKEQEQEQGRVAFLCFCAFSGKERDNKSLLMGSLREDHDMTEEGWQAFEDRMSSLKKPSFGSGPMIGYDIDTVDAMDPTADTSMDPTVDTSMDPTA